ncbi:Uncharacterized conserved protein, DUF1778 family [Paramicrobacterium humi]|uniref:Uncharacterized conserved protein, DUF1778 family n=1 Tax=Paramicrobacterium humi TaxID=640635 RepID=A0A1H4L0L8_9MICO|nr:DUF1778 domain-containing protein [Microbacterium humi]SEB63938.1 Uncharacterized conserved protein, DUF1778 family [Microbacterium humi]
MPYTAAMGALKDKRLELRLTSEQKAMIERAAAVQGRTVSDFSADALTERAREVIDRDRQFAVSAEAFDAFNRLLDEPEQVVEGMVELLQRRSVFSD